MKTIREWFVENLPLDVQQAAFENPYFYGDAKVPTLECAISNCFLWNCSKQGYEYWAKIWRENGGENAD